jgi:ATP-dependent Lon protease
MTKEIDAIQTLPVLPLRDVVIFPAMIFPLLVGRERTLQAVERAMMTTKLVMLVAQRDPAKEEPAPGDLYPVGVVGNILQILKLPNGLVKVLVEGVRRARILNFESEETFLQAKVVSFTER